MMPLTWRNVGLPGFGGGSSALGSAISAFKNVISGGDTMTAQANDAMDRENEYMTNEAIANALRTGSFNPGTNRRVDGGAVLDALAAQEGIESENLLQQSTTQDVIRKTRENDPANIRRQEQRQKRLDELEEQRLQAAITGNNLRAQELQQRINEYQREISVDNDADAINRGFMERIQGIERNEMTNATVESDAAIGQFRIPEIEQAMQDPNLTPNQKAYMTGLLNKYKSDAEKIRETSINDARGRAEAKAYGDIASLYQAAVAQYGTEAANRSIVGQEYQLNMAAQRKAMADRASAEQDALEYQQDILKAMKADPRNKSGWIYDGSDWVLAESKEQVSGNKVKKTDAVDWLSRRNYTITDEDDNKLGNLVDQLGGNRQAVEMALESGFSRAVEDGEFAWFDKNAELDWDRVKETAGLLEDGLKGKQNNFKFDTGTALRTGEDIQDSELRRIVNSLPVGETNTPPQPAQSASGNDDLAAVISRVRGELGGESSFEPHPEHSERVVKKEMTAIEKIIEQLDRNVMSGTSRLVDGKYTSETAMTEAVRERKIQELLERITKLELPPKKRGRSARAQ